MPHEEKTAWDRYLESEEYMNEITPDDTELVTKGMKIEWFRRSRDFWDWRLER